MRCNGPRWGVAGEKLPDLFGHCAHTQSVTCQLLQTYTNTTLTTAVPYRKVTDETGC